MGRRAKDMRRTVTGVLLLLLLSTFTFYQQSTTYANYQDSLYRESLQAGCALLNAYVGQRTVRTRPAPSTSPILLAGRGAASCLAPLLSPELAAASYTPNIRVNDFFSFLVS